MELESQTTAGSTSRSPDVAFPENPSGSYTPHTPPSSCFIPNRIFVGGFNLKVNKDDLRHIFSQHGAVKDVKIVLDHSGMSRGYGFVTFETPDDAQKILHDASKADGIYFRNMKLSIGQAVRRQQAFTHTSSVMMASPGPSAPLPMPCGPLYLTTPSGYPYTYHNGVAYFHSPEMNPPAPHWPQSGSSVMLPSSHQPVCQHQTHHHQIAMASSPEVYMQPSGYLYQPANRDLAQPPVPVPEGSAPGPWI